METTRKKFNWRRFAIATLVLYIVFLIGPIVGLGCSSNLCCN